VIDIGYIFRRAWAITWRHKVLWLFGFFISLGAVGLRFGGNSSQLQRLARELAREFPPDLQHQITDFVQSPYFIVVVVVLVLLGLALSTGVALLGALGRAALVDQVRMAEEQDTVSVKGGWQAGMRHLWPVFLLRLLLGLPVALTTLVGALPVIGILLLLDGQTRPEIAIPGSFTLPLALFGCLGPSVCLSVLLTAPLNVLQWLAVRACVLEERVLEGRVLEERSVRGGVRGSLARAWALLREHIGPLALVWLGLLCIRIGVILVTGLPLAFVMMSLSFVILLTALFSPWLFVALMFIIWLVVWLAGAAVNSVVETFVSAVWTLVYRELTGLGLTGEEAVLSP
jgi:hypothetical protein